MYNASVHIANMGTKTSVSQSVSGHKSLNHTALLTFDELLTSEVYGMLLEC